MSVALRNKQEIIWKPIEFEGLRPFLRRTGQPDKAMAWAPQPGSQVAFVNCPVQECLYEGTRGPGKTEALLVDFLQHCGPDKRTKKQRSDGIPQRAGFGVAWNGILFRRTYPELADVIKKSKRLCKLFFPRARYNESSHTWTFPEGESLTFKFIERPEDYDKYHGHEYPWMAFEELTTWPNDQCYKVMISLNRSPIPGIPLKIRATTNPYGVGHGWVKLRFKLPNNSGRVINKIIRGGQFVGRYFDP